MPSELSIDAGVAAALVCELRAHSPREFVGLLAGTREGDRWHVGHVVALPNVAAGDGTFAVDAPAFAAAEAQLRQQGLDWLGFVHSHPGSPASLSAHDRRQLWCFCVQLIVGECRGAIELRAFWLAHETVQELRCNASATSAAAGCP